MGCIYRRGKTLWIKYHRHGEPFAESTHCDKLEVAKQLLKLREGEIAMGKLPALCFEKVRFDELADDYLTDYRINKKKSLRRAERCVEFLKKQFKGMRATEITTATIKNYIEKRLQMGVNNATINRELSALKRMFNLGRHCTPSKVSMVPYIPMLKEPAPRKGFIEYEDFLALRQELPKELRPVLTFAYHTGWRQAEILNLKWNQVNLRDGIVRLEPGETKNDEGRTIYMDPELFAMMTELHRKRMPECPFVFHRNGRKILYLRKSWNTACKDAEIPGLLFHDLRRSAIRNMVRAGVPERVAMQISGHKTRSVFDRYNIVSQEDLKEAARKSHVFNETQMAQLQNSYNRAIRGQKVVTLRVSNI
jgi:integrase